MWKTWPQPVSADQPCDAAADEPSSASSAATSQQTGHCTPWNIAVFFLACSLEAWRQRRAREEEHPHCGREVIEVW